MGIGSEVRNRHLRGGQAVCLDALLLAWELERRGCILRQAEDGSLFVGPKNLVTPADVEVIRAHKAELLAVIAGGGLIQ